MFNVSILSLFYKSVVHCLKNVELICINFILKEFVCKKINMGKNTCPKCSGFKLQTRAHKTILNYLKVKTILNNIKILMISEKYFFLLIFVNNEGCTKYEAVLQNDM